MSCQLWDGPVNKNGYGRLSLKAGFNHQCAHWAALGLKSKVLCRSPLPKGQFVLHRCGNKLCVNPQHLYIGTHSDNMRDRVLHGQQNTSRLTAEVVKQIRESKGTRKDAAKQFGVSEHIVKKIRCGYTWKFI